MWRTVLRPSRQARSHDDPARGRSLMALSSSYRMHFISKRHCSQHKHGELQIPRPIARLRRDATAHRRRAHQRRRHTLNRTKRPQIYDSKCIHLRTSKFFASFFKKEDSSFLKKRSKRLLIPDACPTLSGQFHDVCAGAEANVFWFFSSEKNCFFLSDNAFLNFTRLFDGAAHKLGLFLGAILHGVGHDSRCGETHAVLNVHAASAQASAVQPV